MRTPWATAFGAAIVAGGAAGTLAYGVAARSSQLFGPSIYRGSGRRKSVALTFDDGPSEGTLELLDYLAKQNIQATFFQCGMNVERNPNIARAVWAAGHEIGNHSYSHPRLPPRIEWKPRFVSPSFIHREFSQTQQIVQAVVGVTPALMRVPYGLRWFGVKAVQRSLGLLGVMWTVIGRDWEWPACAVADLVLRKASPGGIICLHDGRDIQPHPDISEMLAAIKHIVPVLKDQGYRFETVSEMLEPT